MAGKRQLVAGKQQQQRQQEEEEKEQLVVKSVGIKGRQLQAAVTGFGGSSGRWRQFPSVSGSVLGLASPSVSVRGLRSNCLTRRIL